MKPQPKKNIRYNWIVISVVLLLAFRLFLNGAIPLMDKTEARYAEIARIMVETDNWVVPQIDYGVPFWAKPPLSTWLSALSFEWFGVNEFTARLPYFLISVMIALMLGKYAERKELSFWLPTLILFTIPQFFLHAGVVSTDTMLAFSVTLVMLSFWETVSGNRHWYWKYLFFVGIGLGLLGKGPIVLILTIPPLFLWTWLNKSFKRVFILFPWKLGTIIFIGIALPWYYLIEKQSSGFVDYFIVGEHFKRFFDSSWTGDKYGFPKSQPLGMIWVFLLLFALPWIQVVASRIIKQRKSILKNRWISFLIFWLFWTPLFFTVSKSLIHPYIMPVMVPLALLVVVWWKEIKPKKSIVAIALLLPVLALGVYTYAQTTGKVEFYANTDKQFVKEAEELSLPVFHLDKKSYSGQFYSRGKIKAIRLNELQTQISSKEPFIMVVKNRDTSKIPTAIFEYLKPMTFSNTKTLYLFTIENNNPLNTINKD